LSFITWRTWDSIPAAVLERWLAERDAWLRKHDIDLTANWQTHLSRLPAEVVLDFRLLISDRWNEHLDACHGECVLRRAELAEIVANSLQHFDGERYDLTDFVVMPNHVHVLVAFPDEESMLEQCESWKRYTATKINRVLGRSGRFWQQDGFDHLVRSVEQFEHYRNYIADNPRRSGLGTGEYIHFSKPV
jgi:REP element-mobilizing transposase RayT